MTSESLRQRMADSAVMRIASEAVQDSSPVVAEIVEGEPDLSDGATENGNTRSESCGNALVVATGSAAANSARGFRAARVYELMSEDGLGPKLMDVDCTPATKPVESGSVDPEDSRITPSVDAAVPLQAVESHEESTQGTGIDERLSSFRRALGQLREESSRAAPATSFDAKQLELLALQTLQTYLRNCLNSPGEEKYRRINLSNRTLQQRLGRLPSALGVLKAAGFYEDETGQLVLRRNDPGLLWLGVSLVDDAIGVAGGLGG
jgi:hypothetical protein